MITIDDVVHNLMSYFAAIGGNVHRTYSIRDFHTHVMMTTYAPKERAFLGLALARLTEEGIVKSASATEYVLTAKGLNGVRAMRRVRA